MTHRIGLIGLGEMGYAIAALLQDAGVAVHGCDIDPNRIADFEAVGGIACDTPAAVAENSDLLVSLLPSSAALVGVLSSLSKYSGTGTVFAECSTLDLEAKETARVSLAAAGYRVLDAPISGTAEQTRAKQSTVFLSGATEDVEAVSPAFAQFTARQVNAGAFGSGMAIKLVANHLIATHTAAAAEAIRFGEAMGLERAVVHDLIAGGPASSRMFDLRGARMVTGEYKPASGKLAVIAKDRQLIEGAARKLGVPLAQFVTSFESFDRAIAVDDQNDLASVIDHLPPKVSP